MTKGDKYMNKIKIIISLLIITMGMTANAYAWSNGGYSTDPNYPKYGTHDYILQKAIDILPSDMKNKIDTTAASYGSEIPDCTSGSNCIGDVSKHHVYYKADKTLQDGAGATRAQAEYDLAKQYLQQGNKYQFSLHLGAMSHYISDAAVFGHTMGSGTVWGSETHHSDYESYVNNHYSSFGTSFDGQFSSASAYDGTLKLAKETTFDAGTYTNVWMDDNYNWNNPTYVSRTKDMINYDTNIVAEVIYTLISTTPTSTSASITVIAPNGGENWRRGTSHTIKWNSTGNPGSYVKIELLRGGTLNKVISYSTPNDGSYNWYISSLQTLANNYNIRIKSTSNSAYVDVSNGNFTVSS